VTSDGPTGRVDELTESIVARISADDLDRLNRMAARRGVDRETLVTMAIDALLAQEAWSGGFIPPPPAARIPPPIDEHGRIVRSRRFGHRRRTR
jgi:hypothetical protein